jgi:hypothetical protein
VLPEEWAEPRAFTAPLPEDFEAALRALRLTGRTPPSADPPCGRSPDP